MPTANFKKAQKMKLVFLLMASLIATAGWAKEPTPETLATGKGVYEKNCVICHGDKGAGDGVAGLALKPPPRNFKTGNFTNAKNHEKPTVDEVFNAVTNGLSGTPMAAYSSLSEADRRAVAYYVLSLRSGK